MAKIKKTSTPKEIGLPISYALMLAWAILLTAGNGLSLISKVLGYKLVEVGTIEFFVLYIVALLPIIGLSIFVAIILTRRLSSYRRVGAIVLSALAMTALSWLVVYILNILVNIA